MQEKVLQISGERSYQPDAEGNARPKEEWDGCVTKTARLE
jgi:hypothetical protein